jgi:hypothetical protein
MKSDKDKEHTDLIYAMRDTTDFTSVATKLISHLQVLSHIAIDKDWITAPIIVTNLGIEIFLH